MYIYTRISESEFIDAFTRMGRGEQFSIPALRALYDYYSELAESLGEPIELDPIAICCEWSEYPDVEQAAFDYVPDSAYTDEDVYLARPYDEDEAADYLSDHTQTIAGEGFYLVMAH